MKKIVMFLLLFLSTVSLVSCGSSLKKPSQSIPNTDENANAKVHALKSPENVELNGDELVWDKVKDAYKYLVVINEENFETYENRIVLNYNNDLTIYVKIKAVSDAPDIYDSQFTSTLCFYYKIIN